MRPLICLAAGAAGAVPNKTPNMFPMYLPMFRKSAREKKKKKKRLDYISLYSGMKNRIIQVFLKLSYVILIIPSKYHQKKRGYMCT